MPDTYSFRDLVKVACLQECIQRGMDEAEMIRVLKTAAARLRSEKAAALPNLGKAGWDIGKLMLLGLPLALVAGAAPGYIGGQALSNINVGRLPAPEDLKLVDETVFAFFPIA